MESDGAAAKLTSADPATRAAAALELGSTKASERLSLLVERLTTETHLDVIAAFLKAIGQLGSARELSLLAQYIDHTEPKIRATVIEALFGLNTPVALPLIVPFLTDPDQRVRNTAALVLQKLGPERSLHVLQQMLASPHVWMRTSAATALGLFEADVAVPLLERALKDSSPKVQERAALALRRFSRKQLKAITKGISKAAVKAVLKATSQPNLRKLTRKVATLAAPRGGAGVAGAEMLGVSQPGAAPPANPREAGLSRIEAVIAARDGEALSKLVDELGGDEDRFVTARLLSAIGLLEEKAFVPVLVGYLTHPDARVASNAVWALTRLRETSAREQVRPLLRSMQPRLRANAILYCADDAQVDVRAPLEEMIRSADVQTRLSGLFCLAELDRAELLPLADLIEWRPEDAALKATVQKRLAEMEKRGIGAAKQVRELVDRARKSAPAKPVVNEVAKSLAADGKPMAHTDGVTGTLVPISRRRWKTFLLVARALATATDAAVIFVPLFCGLFVLESLAGGMPGAVTPLALLAGAAVFALRDLPQGPGVGKRLLGLAVVSAPDAGLAPRLYRQLPVILLPWGLAELWQATRDGRGQRPTDVKHGLEVVPRGSPMLVGFTVVWLVLCALVAGTYAFVTSRPLAADGLLWTFKQGFRPRPTDEPAFVASADPASEASVASGAPASTSLEKWTHATMGVTVPVPRGWSIAAAGSAFLELRPRPGSAVTTGSIVVAMPDEIEGAPEVNAWGEESARRFNQELEREGLRLTFWTPPAGPTSLGGTAGRLYRGDIMGGQEAVVFACGRTVRPMAITCRTGGEPGLARRLAESIVRDCQPLPAGPAWRRYRSPFRTWDLDVPAGWAVAREDRGGALLRPGVYADAGWIRLDATPAKGTAQERIKQVHRPLWEQHGFEILRSAPTTIGAAPGVVLDLRARGIATARFRLAWIEGDAPYWIAEWLERDALNDPPPLERLVRSPKLSHDHPSPSE